MRRSVALVSVVCLFVVGCESSTRPDTDAAEAFVRKFYSAPHIAFQFDTVEGPEYATIPKIPRDHVAKGYPDRSADGAVRVRFTWKDGNRTTHDDMVVWVTNDHQAVGWSSTPNGDKWRQFVHSVAKK